MTTDNHADNAALLADLLTEYGENLLVKATYLTEMADSLPHNDPEHHRLNGKAEGVALAHSTLLSLAREVALDRLR
jgi:hypothetical protein